MIEKYLYRGEMLVLCDGDILKQSVLQQIKLFML